MNKEKRITAAPSEYQFDFANTRESAVSVYRLFRSHEVPIFRALYEFGTVLKFRLTIGLA